MAVNRNIGFLNGIISNVNRLTSRMRTTPVVRISDKKIDYTNLKAKSVIRITDGATGVFHWNFHNWADDNNVVGK